jgi:hypothetical protein
MVKDNIFIGIATLAVAIGYHVLTPTPPSLGMDQVSPTLYVDILSLLMALCGCYCLVKGGLLHRKKRRAECETELDVAVEKAAESEAGAGSRKKQWSLRRPLAIIGLTCGYTIAMYYVGFLIASFAAALGALLIMGVRRPLTLTAVPISAALVMYAMFGLGLKILLPEGILFQ